MAELLGLTLPHLSKVYQDAFGENLSRFLKRKQVEYASHLLEHTPLTTAEIAVAAGFGTTTTLFRLFPAFTGTTPRGARLRDREDLKKRD